MIIQEVQTYLADPILRSQRSLKRERPALSESEYKDSPPAPKTKQELASIRARIKSGHYNSEAVLEDLGHSFAKVLDQLL
jgi:hypothetical protein